MATTRIVLERCNMGVLEDYQQDTDAIALVFIDADDGTMYEIPMKKEKGLQFADQVKNIITGQPSIIVADSDDMPPIPGDNNGPS